MSAAPFAGYRIGIVGGCQVLGLALWLEALLPGAEIGHWHVGVTPAAEVLAQLPKRDLIVTQFLPDSPDGPFDVAAVAKFCGTAVHLPTVVFAGYHPDLVAVPLRKGPRPFVPGAMGLHHSAIVAAAYSLRRPERDVPGLFNAMVYKAAGYFDVFEAGRTALVKLFAEHGFDIADAFAAWQRSGAFMYTDNHPAPVVFETLARLLLARVGLTPVEPAAAPRDSLIDSSVWPIPAVLARRLGIAAQPVFRVPLQDVDSQAAREITLPDFVARSYAAFAEHERYGWGPHDRIDTTLHALGKMVS